MNRPRRLFAAACVAIVGAAAVHPSAETKTVRTELRPADSRSAAPDFWLKDGRGKTVRLSDFRGRVVLLDFWATMCGGCVEEIPAFIDIAKTFKPRGLATIGVSEDIVYSNLSGPDEAWTKVKPFVQAHKLGYTVVMGDEGVTKSYGITALPLTYLIDARGRVAAVYSGVVDRANVESNITALLKERRN
jgi:peroxiredoxin